MIACKSTEIFVGGWNMEIPEEIPRYGEEYSRDIILRKKPQVREEEGTEIFVRLQEFRENVIVILHTVNNNEKWAVLDHMEPPKLEGKPLTERTVDLYEPNNIVLGMFGGYKSALIQTEMGVDSREEIESALDEFPKAKFVLAIGVAYACDRDKFKYGDVLVSKFIDGVGNIKYTRNGLIIFRASSSRFTSVSQFLKNVFARGEETWYALKNFKCTKVVGTEDNGRCSKVHPGVIISDKSLIDDETTRDKFVSNTPEAVGGEMEGVTLVEVQHSLARKKCMPREFGVIVIKGVADYADGQKEKNWQLTSAMAAASYAEHKLNETGGKLFSDEKVIKSIERQIKNCSDVVRLLLRLLIVIIAVIAATCSPDQYYSNLLNSTIPVSVTALETSQQEFCDKIPKNLRDPYTPFMGRDDNMTYLEHVLLYESVHVLGINGPPGFGKSALAINLGWKMAKKCFDVGYIDMDEENEIVSYAVKVFNERRQVQEWKRPLNKNPSNDTINDDVIFDEGIVKWFDGKALLIVDNCNCMLNDTKNRKIFFKFLAAMIQSNKNGRIVITSDEKLNLYGLTDYNYLHFPVRKLPVEASIAVLKNLSPSISLDDAKEIAISVEHCPIALTVVGSQLKMGNVIPSRLIKSLNNRKDALKVLNKTEHRELNFVAIMDVAFDLLKVRERMSAMFFSFFPSYFHINTAIKILKWSDKKYNIFLENKDIVVNSIEELNTRSLLEKMFFGEVERYKMHRLIKTYFMNRGELYSHNIEADFNSSFRIYFSNLQVRTTSLNEVQENINAFVLSDFDRHNFHYLTQMLLSNFHTHLYSEDELVYLAFAYYKGLMSFDYNYFRTMLDLYTYPHKRVATLPKGWQLTETNILGLASDFSYFYVNVLCNITSHDICITIYLDLLYQLYQTENCKDIFEDNIEDKCRMVQCDYSDDYFAILKALNVFHKCSNSTDSDARNFCDVLLYTHYMCNTFDLLIPPLKYILVAYIILVFFSLLIMFITCLKIKKLPLFFFKHLGFLFIIWATSVIFTYTRTLRNFLGLSLDAAIEVHARNLACSFFMIIYILGIFFNVLFLRCSCTFSFLRTH